MGGRVVVGIDGSDTSRRAARWAAHEARLRGAKLEIVSAWHIPLYGYAHVGSVTAISEDIVKGLIENAERHLAEVTREAQVEAGGIELETIAAEGQPASVLLDLRRRRPVGGRVAWTGWLPRAVARLGQSAMRAACLVPGRDRPAHGRRCVNPATMPVSATDPGSEDPVDPGPAARVVRPR